MASLLLLFKGYDRRGRQHHTLRATNGLEREEDGVTRHGISPRNVVHSTVRSSHDSAAVRVESVLETWEYDRAVSL